MAGMHADARATPPCRISGTDIKDKAELIEARKRVERQMERFKVRVLGGACRTASALCCYWPPQGVANSPAQQRCE